MGFQGKLELGDGLRAQLGLEDDESVHVLHTGSRTVLLERTKGDSRSVALPWDRDLVLNADVRSFPLAGVLSLVHEAGKSGFLFLSQDSHEKAVYLVRPEVRGFDASVNPLERKFYEQVWLDSGPDE